MSLNGTKLLKPPARLLHAFERGADRLNKTCKYRVDGVYRLYYGDEAFNRTYLLLLSWLHGRMDIGAFYYQVTPTIRFDLPIKQGDDFRLPNGDFMGHHSDTMLGHSEEEIQFWMPLCDVSGKSALGVATGLEKPPRN